MANNTAKIFPLTRGKDNPELVYPVSVSQAIYHDNTPINQVIGDADISNIGDGTITGAIASLGAGIGGVNGGTVDTTDIDNKIGNTDISDIGDGTITDAIREIADEYVTVDPDGVITVPDLSGVNFGGGTINESILGDIGDISDIGDGTITGAIKEIVDNMQGFASEEGFGGIRYTDNKWQHFDESQSMWKEILIRYVGDNFNSGDTPGDGGTTTKPNNGSAYVPGPLEIYGFRLDTNATSPTTTISYLGDNENFRSSYMDFTNNKFEYGDWENVWFIKYCKPCMLTYDGNVDYYLNKNDYSYREDGITPAAISSTSYAGNVMIEFPLVYVKIVINGDGTFDFWLSNQKVDDTYKPWWSFYDESGNVIQTCYMSAYEAYQYSSTLRSLSGYDPVYYSSNPVSGSMSGVASLNSMTVDNSSIWQLALFADRQLVNMLLLLIGKSTDTQAVFGNGNVYYETQSSQSAIHSKNIIYTGTMDSKGMFWGTNSTTTHVGVKVFGIENWWGNESIMMSGLNYNRNTGEVNAKLTYSQVDGTTTDGYNVNSEGYITLPFTIEKNTASYINSVTVNAYGIIPNGAGTTYANRYGYDCLSTASSYTTHYISTAGMGATLYPTRAGAFTLDFSTYDGLSSPTIGTMISCKPKAAVEE